jgi:hypothetical protein
MRRLLTAVVLLAIAGGILYLRDPPWLIAYTTGLRAWERTQDGTAFRWSAAHSSFFVPADAGMVLLPVSTTFDAGADQPMLVTVAIDDVRVSRVLLEDAEWKHLTFTLPNPGSRRIRRIDVRASVPRGGYRRFRIGELKVSSDGVNWRPCCFPDR